MLEQREWCEEFTLVTFEYGFFEACKRCGRVYHKVGVTKVGPCIAERWPCIVKAG